MITVIGVTSGPGLFRLGVHRNLSDLFQGRVWTTITCLKCIDSCFKVYIFSGFCFVLSWLDFSSVVPFTKGLSSGSAFGRITAHRVLAPWSIMGNTNSGSSKPVFLSCRAATWCLTFAPMYVKPSGVARTPPLDCYITVPAQEVPSVHTREFQKGGLGCSTCKPSHMPTRWYLTNGVVGCRPAIRNMSVTYRRSGFAVANRWLKAVRQYKFSVIN